MPVRMTDDGVGSTTTNHRRRAAAAALVATTMAAAMTEVRAMAAAKAVTTRRWDGATMRTIPTMMLKPERMTPTRTSTRKMVAVVAIPRIGRFAIPPRLHIPTEFRRKSEWN